MQTSKPMDNLIANLRSDDPAVRQQAAFDLGETENLAATPHLVEALNDDDRYVQVHAIQALRNLRDSAATESLCQPKTTPHQHH